MPIEHPHKPAATLGDVLYAKSKNPVLEQDWVTLVRSIAARDQRALQAIYEMAHRLVFTLIMRIAANRETAEELTIDVFHNIWQRASRYDAANGTVLGWIMKQARSRAIDWLRFESRRKHSHSGDLRLLIEATADPQEKVKLREQGEALGSALAALEPDERRAIETAFFAGRALAETAARLNQPLDAVKTHIRSGLHSLRQRLTLEAMNDGPSGRDICEWSEITCAYALQALLAHEVPVTRTHIASCVVCQREWESLRPIVDRFVSWPTDVLRPTTSLQARLAFRIAQETGKQPVTTQAQRWSAPEWEQVLPGIECKLLATDTERHRVSMLVRLAPGVNYPGHIHEGIEELYLLHGELWIDEHKLFPGDYNYSEPGTSDERVWSETGCTCLLITSTKDILR